MMSTESKIRHEWFQTDSKVSISVFIKNVDPSTVIFNLTARTLALHIKPADSSLSEIIALDIDPLSFAVDPDSSIYEVLKTKIEITLAKAKVGVRWPALQGDFEESAVVTGGFAATTAAAAAAAPPAYPTSSKKKKDWSAVEKSIEEDKPTGDAALNALFQQIYKDASDDTRRAMMKSYIESNGTCLSTNWEEVGSKTVECSPPEGME
eukprot:jgi/Hompol1/6830/HPOL_000298-RA